MSTNSTENSHGNTATYGIISLHLWTQSIGRSSVTVWRWRKRGWLKTINIYGKPYVTDEAIKEFNRRAAAGEFAQEPNMQKTS